jgi:hypothetical protein
LRLWNLVCLKCRKVYLWNHPLGAAALFTLAVAFVGCFIYYVEGRVSFGIAILEFILMSYIFYIWKLAIGDAIEMHNLNKSFQEARRKSKERTDEADEM